MKIIKMIVDKKPSHCIVCPLSKLHICGKDHVEHPTSGAAYIERVPDSRCLVRVGRNA